METHELATHSKQQNVMHNWKIMSHSDLEWAQSDKGVISESLHMARGVFLF